MRNAVRHFIEDIRLPHKRIFRREHRRWLNDNGEARRYAFDFLDHRSMVFDIGGFEGTWTDAIRSRYGCKVEIFEPHPRFAEYLEQKFNLDSAVTVHPFALGGQTGRLELSDDHDASSSVAGGAKTVTGKIVDTATFFGNFHHDRIDLAKINIEGGEYELLPALMDNGSIARFRTLQIQFHLFDKSHIALRDSIVARLAKTHRQDWAYEFVWEQWTLRDN